MDTQINTRMKLSTTLINLFDEPEDVWTKPFLRACYEQLLDLKFQLEDDLYKYEYNTIQHSIIKLQIQKINLILHKLN
jgi:hypothetical protein